MPTCHISWKGYKSLKFKGLTSYQAASVAPSIGVRLQRWKGPILLIGTRSRASTPKREGRGSRHCQLDLWSHSAWILQSEPILSTMRLRFYCRATNVNKFDWWYPGWNISCFNIPESMGPGRRELYHRTLRHRKTRNTLGKTQPPHRTNERTLPSSTQTWRFTP